MGVFLVFIRWGFMPCLGHFYFVLRGGVLLWVCIGLDIIELKYVGCKSVGYSRFV